MEPFLPPRTIIVVDDHPSDVSSFICSVLDAHALPYAVQVINPGAPAFDHLAPHGSDGPPRLFCSIARGRRGQARALWRRLTALWLADATARAEVSTQRPTATRPSTPRRLRWPRAWPGVGFGLVVSLVAGARYCGRRGSRPACPAVHRHAAPTRPPSSSVPRRRQPACR